jgi:phospho-N-acetylmuramoyl-pentapeptide-transferase
MPDLFEKDKDSYVEGKNEYFTKHREHFEKLKQAHDIHPGFLKLEEAYFEFEPLMFDIQYPNYQAYFKEISVEEVDFPREETKAKLAQIDLGRADLLNARSYTSIIDFIIGEKTTEIIKGKGYEKDGLFYTHDTKDLITNVPFLKGNNLNYDKFFEKLGLHPSLYFIPFFLILIFIITAVSNGANITDGIDGLAAGSSALIGISLAVLTYITGNSIFSDYLNVLYIPYLGELVIFVSAFIAACVGFLWWNSYPAQIFMGDTGSLALGGIIATIAIIIRKELMIPLLCGIFLAENLSVMIQVAYFKYTKKKFGEGRRIFLMSPLHHHFQKKGIPESKIVMRFWIVGVFLSVMSIVLLKLR